MLQQVDLYRDGHKQGPLDMLYWNLRALGRSKKWMLERPAAMRRNILRVVMLHLEYLVKDGRNLITYLYGSQGEAKSICALKLKQTFIKLIEKLVGIVAEYKYAASIDESLNYYPSLSEWGVVHQDEDPDLEGKGSGTALKRLNNLIMQLRGTHKSLIFCSPQYGHYPGLTLFFEPVGKDISDWTTKVIVRYIPTSEPVPLRETYLGYFIMDLSSVRAEYDGEYSVFKKRNLANIQQNKGGVGVTVDTAKLDSLVDELKDVAIAAGWGRDSMKALYDTYVDDLVAKYDKAGKKLSFSDAERKSLSRKTYDKYGLKSGTKAVKSNISTAQAALIVSSKFNVDEKDLLIQLENEQRKNWSTLKRDVLMFRDNVYNGRTLDVIGKSHGIQPPAVSKAITRVKGAIAEMYGPLWEQYKKKMLEDAKNPDGSKTWDEVVWVGGTGKPDVYATKGKTIWIWSCKCYSFTRSCYVMLSGEMNAEIEFAKQCVGKYEEIKMFVDMMNRADGTEEEKFVDFQNPPPTISFSYKPPAQGNTPP